MKGWRFLSFLLLALLLAACSRRVDEVREGALTRVQHALEGRRLPGGIGWAGSTHLTKKHFWGIMRPQ